MEYTLYHRGVPVGLTEAAELSALRATLVRPLPAGMALRPLLPPWPRGADRAGAADAGAAALADALELWDERGTPVAAARIRLWTADPVHLLAMVDVETDPAAVGAFVLPARGTGAAGAELTDG